MPNPLRKSDVVRAGEDEDEDEGEWNCGDIPNFLLPSQFPHFLTSWMRVRLHYPSVETTIPPLTM